MAGELATGSVLAGYRIEGLVGRGGMGLVYRARHTTLNRMAGLKVIAPEIAQDLAFRERFIREAQLAASLQHPNIIPVYDAGDVAGTLYIAMHYVEGLDLREILRREGPLPVDRALSIVGTVGSALDAAHERGLVHRDVKPGNVLVAADSGQVYLTDFGLTKRIGAASQITRTGVFLGTLDYAAPEQIQAQAVDGRTDIYALGCLLYECLTARRPYERETDAQVMYAHLTDPPPSPSAVRSDLPPAIDLVVAQAMAKRPADRYATAAELAADARTALTGQAAATPTLPVAPPAPTRVVSRPARSRRAVVVSAVLVLVAATIAGVALLNRGGGPTEPSKAAAKNPPLGAPTVSTSAGATGTSGPTLPTPTASTQASPSLVDVAGSVRIQFFGGIASGSTCRQLAELHLFPRIVFRDELGNVLGAVTAGRGNLFVGQTDPRTGDVARILSTRFSTSLPQAPSYAARIDGIKDHPGPLSFEALRNLKFRYDISVEEPCDLTVCTD